MDQPVKQTYTDIDLKHALSGVFQSLWFDDLTLKIQIQLSYFDNFHHLVAYARANNIDEMEYINSIRECLLSKHIRDRVQ